MIFYAAGGVFKNNKKRKHLKKWKNNTYKKAASTLHLNGFFIKNNQGK